MTSLHRLTGVDRSNAVSKAFGDALKASYDGRALVKYRDHHGATTKATVFLIGLGWNPTYAGTQEAVIVRLPGARYVVEMIPYTRLISIEGV